MKFLIFFVLFLCSLYSHANYRLYRPWAKTLNDGAYQLGASADYFTSSARYDLDGNEEPLEEGEAFSVFDTELEVKYALGNSLQISGGLRARMINTTFPLGTEDISTSKSGLESYFANVKYELGRSGALLYAFDFGVRKSAYTNSDYESLNDLGEDEIVLGDSGTLVHVGGSLSYLSSNDHSYNAKVWARKPGNNLSNEIFYEIGSAWTWSSSALNIGLEGINSLNGSSYSDNPGQRPIQGRAPSNLYNSINRSYMAPKAQFFTLFGSWKVGLGVKQVLAGTSTDKGTSFSVSLVKESGGVKTSDIKKSKFKEYNIEATVLKVSPRGKFLQIDQGLGQDVARGMRFDIYQTDFFGGNELVATAVAYEVSVERSILKIVKKYTRKRVKKGFTARAK